MNETLWDKIKSFFTVTLITVLIWLYAEGTHVKTFTKEPIDVQFVGPGGEELAIGPVKELTVDVTFRSSEAVKQRILSRPIQIIVEPGPRPLQTINMADALESSSLGDLAANVIETDPAQVELTVEPLETVTLPVEVVHGEVEMVAPPVIDPPQVLATMPRSRANLAQASKAIARLDMERLQRLDENVEQTDMVTVEAPPELQEEDWPTFDPIQVRVTYTIREQSGRAELTSVPIWISATSNILERWNIKLSENVVQEKVVLLGPSDVIAQIEANEIQVRAEVRLRPAQLEEGVRTAELIISDLPPSVTVLSPNPLPTVTIIAERKPEPGVDEPVGPN